MNPATYAAMSDPLVNPQFRRLWRPPDNLEKQRRRPGKETAPHSNQQNQIIISALLRHAARLRTTAALLPPGSAA
jgi:hypothetical protein